MEGSGDVETPSVLCFEVSKLVATYRYVFEGILYWAAKGLSQRVSL